jgi:hypothetical protein
VKLYKLTDQNGYTYNNTHWAVGTTHTLPVVDNPELCKDVFHAYTNLNLGLLVNRVHANIKHPKAWLCEGDVVVEDVLKVGCLELAVLEELELPDWYAGDDTKKFRRVQTHFAVLCAEAVLPLFESVYPKCDRLKRAIEAVKTLLNGDNSISSDALRTLAASVVDFERTVVLDSIKTICRTQQCTDGAFMRYINIICAVSYMIDTVFERHAHNAAFVASYAASADNNIDFACLADYAVEMAGIHETL